MNGSYTMSSMSSIQINQLNSAELNIPSDEGSLDLAMSPSELAAVCRDLLKSGDISTDG